VDPFSCRVEGTFEMRHRGNSVAHHFHLVFPAAHKLVGHGQTVGPPHVPANTPSHSSTLFGIRDLHFDQGHFQAKNRRLLMNKKMEIDVFHFNYPQFAIKI